MSLVTAGTEYCLVLKKEPTRHQKVTLIKMLRRHTMEGHSWFWKKWCMWTCQNKGYSGK